MSNDIKKVDEEGGERIADRERQGRGGATYCPPELSVIGRAVDLVQGRNYGKRTDGYSAHYYES